MKNSVQLLAMVFWLSVCASACSSRPNAAGEDVLTSSRGGTVVLDRETGGYSDPEIAEQERVRKIEREQERERREIEDARRQDFHDRWLQNYE